LNSEECLINNEVFFTIRAKATFDLLHSGVSSKNKVTKAIAVPQSTHAMQKDRPLHRLVQESVFLFMPYAAST
jgi:hypothetical protein